MFCDKPVGYTYFNTNTRLLYFISTAGNGSSSNCGVVWTDGIPFGKGEDGKSVYNAYCFSKVVPAPIPNHTKVTQLPIGALGQVWHDAPTPPATMDGEKLYLSMTNYTILTNGVTDPSTITWSAPQQIDGDEGVSAGVWIVWSDSPSYTTPIPAPHPVTGALSLPIDWYDDTGYDSSKTPYVMAMCYYKPQSDGSWAWTQWVYTETRGEKGAKGVDGFTYVPDSVFIIRLKGSSNSFAAEQPIGMCLNADLSINRTGGLKIDTSQKDFFFKADKSTVARHKELHDGIPIGVNPETEVVWMVQGIFNDSDNMCTGGASSDLYWRKPSLMQDTRGFNRQYHRGKLTAGGSDTDYPPTTDYSGFKPNDPVEDGNPDSRGWFDEAIDPDLDALGGAFWVAEKDYSLGFNPPWQVYQIRGEDGKSAAPTVFFSNVHPYDPNHVGTLPEMSTFLADPTLKPEKWTGPRSLDDHDYSDNCSSNRASYYISQKTGDNYIPLDPAIDPPPRWTTLYDSGTGKGGYEVYRIQDTTLTPPVPNKWFQSTKLVKQGHIIDRQYVHESSVVRLSIVGDTARFTNAGPVPDDSTTFIDGLTGNKDVECVGYPTIFITNWKDKDSGNALYMKYRLSRWGYATAAAADADLNDAAIHFKSYKYIGEWYHPNGEQLPKLGDSVIDILTNNPIVIDSSLPWYIGVSEYDWMKDPQTTQAQYLVEMNDDGTVKSWGFMPAP